MSLTINLEPEIEHRLLHEARRAGESLDSFANRILDAVLPAPAANSERFTVRPFALETPEKWRGLTPKQIDYEMEEEAYEEKLERARHESTGVRV